MLWPLSNCLEVGGGGEYLTSISADWRSAAKTLPLAGWGAACLQTQIIEQKVTSVRRDTLSGDIFHEGVLFKTPLRRAEKVIHRRTRGEWTHLFSHQGKPPSTSSDTELKIKVRSGGRQQNFLLAVLFLISRIISSKSTNLSAKKLLRRRPGCSCSRLAAVVRAPV